jgi:hypothetical protein
VEISQGSFLFPSYLVIDEVLRLGNRIWGTLEGNAVSELVYMLARSFGEHFSSDQIHKLVIRGDSYSRVGINALGIMYDEYPEHMKSLRLGEFFRNHDDWRVAYFCNLRDKYPGMTVVALMSTDYDCALDGYNLHPNVKSVCRVAHALKQKCGLCSEAGPAFP